jgi:biopolymer transport protein ExbD
MFRFQERSRTIGGFESAAMADIIFLLLIFFLLSSSFILPTQIPVNPPKSSQAQTAEDEPIVVTVSHTGEVYVGKEKVPMAELGTALSSRLATSKVKTVAVRGDESVDLGRVVEVMDLALEAGAEKLGIATERKTVKPSR